MLWILIILLDTLANFRGGNPHDGISVGVVIGGTAENLHTENSFFELIRLAGQRVRHHILQEARIPLAGIE